MLDKLNQSLMLYLLEFVLKARYTFQVRSLMKTGLNGIKNTEGYLG